MKLIRKLYDWVLAWAETPYGLPALAVLAFVEACFFPIPPDVLLIALCLALPTKSYRFALVATIGSVLGGIVGYLIGWGSWELVAEYFFRYVPGFTEDGFLHVKGWFDQYDFWTVFAAGFTPIPYKIFTISAGAFQINLPIFVVASLVSRGLRFYLVAALLYYYGRPARDFIDRYFNLLTILFMVLCALIILLFNVLR